MIGLEIKKLREALGLTQAQLAQLIGVHHLTVWKWENGQSVPTPHQQMLLSTFGKAQQQEPEIGDQVAQLLVGAGVGVALYYLLKAVFGKEK